MLQESWSKLEIGKINKTYKCYYIIIILLLLCYNNVIIVCNESHTKIQKKSYNL